MSPFFFDLLSRTPPLGDAVVWLLVSFALGAFVVMLTTRTRRGSRD